MCTCIVGPTGRMIMTRGCESIVLYHVFIYSPLHTLSPCSLHIFTWIVYFCCWVKRLKIWNSVEVFYKSFTKTLRHLITETATCPVQRHLIMDIYTHPTQTLLHLHHKDSSWQTSFWRHSKWKGKRKLAKLAHICCPRLRNSTERKKDEKRGGGGRRESTHCEIPAECQITYDESS